MDDHTIRVGHRVVVPEGDTTDRVTGDVIARDPDSGLIEVTLNTGTPTNAVEQTGPHAGRYDPAECTTY